MTRNLKGRRRLARIATGVGVVLALVSIWPFAFGPTYALGVVCVFVGGVLWIDCNAELMRREGTTRRAGA